MKIWISDIWRKYSYFELKNETMLVMDDASMHKLDVIKKKINDWETSISMIPGGLTRYLQPLNVFINKPFKDELRKKYTDYWMETKNSNAKVSQNKLINWVWEVWYSKSIFSNMIRKSFKAAGITLNLDGSEDEMFVSNNKLLGNYQEMVYEDEQPINPNELIEEKKEFDDENDNDNDNERNSSDSDEQDNEEILIELVEQTIDQQIDGISIYFKLSEEEEKHEEDTAKAKLINELQKKADGEI